MKILLVRIFSKETIIYSIEKFLIEGLFSNLRSGKGRAIKG
jgi:hypothetical protein